MAALLELCRNVSILQIGGTLRAPVKGTLSRRVQTLIDRGEQRIVLDLARLSDIDAEGIGELVRAYEMTSAAGGVLSIAHANRRVGQLLQVAGLLKLLSGCAEELAEMTETRVPPSLAATSSGARSS